MFSDILSKLGIIPNFSGIKDIFKVNLSDTEWEHSISNIDEYILCSRNVSKCSTFVNSFNSHNIPVDVSPTLQRWKQMHREVEEYASKEGSRACAQRLDLSCVSTLLLSQGRPHSVCTPFGSFLAQKGGKDGSSITLNLSAWSWQPEAERSVPGLQKYVEPVMSFKVFCHKRSRESLNYKGCPWTCKLSLPSAKGQQKCPHSVWPVVGAPTCVGQPSILVLPYRLDTRLLLVTGALCTCGMHLKGAFLISKC